MPSCLVVWPLKTQEANPEVVVSKEVKIGVNDGKGSDHEHGIGLSASE